MQILDFVLRLGAALLMGAVVGLERQWRQRMAGTRTNALVSVVASALVMYAFMVRDTSRSEAQIVSYVVSGVGFLGAGVIFKDAGSVRGLNTAATIWCSAAIGAISGLGNALHALVLTVQSSAPTLCSVPGIQALPGAGGERGTGSHLWIRADLPPGGRGTYARVDVAGHVAESFDPHFFAKRRH